MASTMLDPIRAEVARLTTVEASVKALLVSLNAKIQAAPTLAEAQEIAAEFAAKNDLLANDVVENTPVEPV